ncbi:MAG TPA: chromate transporter [Atribacter sp.]|jgi:chromate transporter|uniref:chromate transporter n=1 Tax=Atribacter sp. TaxID=2847780 RepID=UPI002B76E615|nr:chromate transporter [Atribacter sp.]MDD3713427.1 chromate transporter [Atribacterota bacterium]MDI9594326.1 chromate transporter [Atribacterota bacterium]HQK82534.1 chromate transporter [Atribacter sp.]
MDVLIKRKKGILRILFVSFFQIGAFTWGGGYAMVPLIQRELVQKKRLMNDEDFINILSIAQSFPGAIAINTAGLVGNRLAGFPGLLVAILGSVLPSFTVMIMAATILFHFGDLVLVQRFFRGAVPAIVALIATGIFSIAKRALKQRFDLILSGVLFVLVLVFDFHPFWIILIGALTGLVRKS